MLQCILVNFKAFIYWNGGTCYAVQPVNAQHRRCSSKTGRKTQQVPGKGEICAIIAMFRVGYVLVCVWTVGELPLAP